MYSRCTCTVTAPGGHHRWCGGGFALKNTFHEIQTNHRREYEDYKKLWQSAVHDRPAQNKQKQLCKII